MPHTRYALAWLSYKNIKTQITILVVPCNIPLLVIILKISGNPVNRAFLLWIVLGIVYCHRYHLILHPSYQRGIQMCTFLFVGHNTLVCDFYRMNTNNEIVNTLEDGVRCSEAMEKLLATGQPPRFAINCKVSGAICIKNQNYVEWRMTLLYRKSKANIKNYWRTTIRICYFMNHTDTKSPK